MPNGLLQHRHLVLAALQEGDVLLTDSDGRPLPYTPEELMAPSVPRPAVAHIRDVATGQRVRLNIYDAKDLVREQYLRYLVAAAEAASPESAYWRLALV